VLERHLVIANDDSLITGWRGAGRLQDNAVLGDGIVRGSRGMCPLVRVSDALGMKHLLAQFGLTVTSTCLG
jgi:hypothetical protein